MSKVITYSLLTVVAVTMAPYHCAGPEREPVPAETEASTYKPLPGDGLRDAAEACTDSADELQLVFDALVTRYGEQYVLQPGQPIEVPVVEGVDLVCPTNDISHLP